MLFGRVRLFVSHDMLCYITIHEPYCTFVMDIGDPLILDMMVTISCFIFAKDLHDLF